ncbi:MAG: hypothetical protein HQL85_12955 [Magnetococcales bacterium]|nr:hypothetical protein [Magnetococcales bacterium]
MKISLTLIEIIGCFAIILFSLALLPRVWKAWKTQSTKDISLLWLIIAIVSSIFWLLYGILLPEQAVVLAKIKLNFSFTLVESIGWFAIILSSLALLPQIWKAWKTQSTKDISLLWLIMAIVSSLSWLLYGILLPAQAVVLANMIGSSVVLLLLIMKIRFG